MYIANELLCKLNQYSDIIIQMEYGMPNERSIVFRIIFVFRHNLNVQNIDR